MEKVRVSKLMSEQGRMATRRPMVSSVFTAEGLKMNLLPRLRAFVWTLLLCAPLISLATDKPEVFAQLGHSGDIQAIAIAPNGRTIASASQDRSVRVWDVASRRELRKLEGHGWSVNSVAFSPDGGTIVSGSQDQTVRLWDVVSGRELRKLEGHGEPANSVAFSPDGRTIAAISYNTVRLWDVASGRELRKLEGPGGFVNSVAFSPDGRTIVSGSADVRLWDVDSGRELRKLEGHGWSVNSVAFSPDGRTIVSGSNDKTVRVWDVAIGRELRKLEGHGEQVNSVAFSPDGGTIVSGSWDQTVRLWDVASGRELRKSQGYGHPVSSVAFSPDGRTIASGGLDRTVRLWDVASGRELRKLEGHGRVVNSVTFSPDGRTIVSGSDDKTVRLWDVDSGRELRKLEGHSGDVRSAAFSADGKRIVSSSQDGTVNLWDAPSGKALVSMVGMRNGAWLAITPEGYFHGSDKAAEHINVRIGDRVFGIDQYRDQFYRPDLVRESIAGRQGAGLRTLAQVRLAPRVEIVNAPASVTSAELTLQLRVTEQGGGTGDVRIYVNGTAVNVDTRGLQAPSAAPGLRDYRIRLANGENEIKAVVYNADNSMHSTEAVHRVAATFARSGRPRLIALVAGINEFDNPRLNLSNSVADAKLFGGLVEKQGGKLFEAATVVHVLTPAQTSKASLRAAFEKLRQEVTPEDVFVFYVASHGVVVDGEYFLITSNVGATSTERLRRDALTQRELGELIGNIPAQKKLVILDTCQSGQLGDALQVAILTRGMSEEVAVKLLSRAMGSVILSAAMSFQDAIEGYQGHGLFTYVLAEGLRGAADRDKDGFVTVNELTDYLEEQVPEIALKAFKRKQYPYVSRSGNNFPLVQTR